MEDCPKLTRHLTVNNKLGLHARPASLFAKTANQYSADITVKKDDGTIDAKSIMGVLMLGAVQGTELEIYAQGKDAEEALDALEQLVKTNFGED